MNIIIEEDFKNSKQSKNNLCYVLVSDNNVADIQERIFLILIIKVKEVNYYPLKTEQN